MILYHPVEGTPAPAGNTGGEARATPTDMAKGHPEVIRPDEAMLRRVMSSPEMQSALHDAARAAFYTEHSDVHVIVPTDDALPGIMASSGFRAALVEAAKASFYRGDDNLEVIDVNDPRLKQVLASSAFRDALQEAASACTDVKP